MQVALTRQDLQGALDYAKNRIVERLATKQELQTYTEMVVQRVHSNTTGLLQQEYHLSQQILTQIGNVLRRLSIIEDRLASIEHELNAIPHA